MILNNSLWCRNTMLIGYQYLSALCWTVERHTYFLKAGVMIDIEENNNIYFGKSVTAFDGGWELKKVINWELRRVRKKIISCFKPNISLRNINVGCFIFWLKDLLVWRSVKGNKCTEVASSADTNYKTSVPCLRVIGTSNQSELEGQWHNAVFTVRTMVVKYQMTGCYFGKSWYFDITLSFQLYQFYENSSKGWHSVCYFA